LDSWDVLCFLCFKLEYCTVIAYRPGTLGEEKPQLRGLESAGVFIQGGGKDERPQGLEGAEVIFEDNGEEQDGPHGLESARVVLMAEKLPKVHPKCKEVPDEDGTYHRNPDVVEQQERPRLITSHSLAEPCRCSMISLKHQQGSRSLGQIFGQRATANVLRPAPGVSIHQTSAPKCSVTPQWAYS
jgi:hypothetical protein